ncbi:hypothetical protein [Streptomyces sp. NBC_01092]|uniref:hypothetical protein n=1 Tax=Streptomyces sp. NBC_01092 TaxID=2903748 RepID=UPI00386F965C|nr:hypothetical protein OG254_38215 [Streptomyces sp. NBC_01092]
MADSIHIPVEELKDTITRLAEIRARIEEKTGLERAGTEEDVGDGELISAVSSFDGAWKSGHETVQDNVDTYKEATQGIVDNFEKTDTDITADL